MRSIGDGDTGVRLAAIQALGELGPVSRDAVPLLVRTLSERNDAIRQAAIRALGSMGPDAAQAAPALRKVVAEDQPPALRPLALEALGKIEAR